MTPSRLNEIEAKVSLIEDSVDELNHTVFRLQQQAGQLQEQLRFLYGKLQALTEMPAATQGPRDEIPPHY
ncbi:MAG: SlyX family protein [Candidatus Accumulibacter sp.]|nr:SlyX family protein [Accumulibacter sp.]